MDQHLIQVVRSRDDRIGKSCVIQHLTGLLGQISQVAAVQADAVRLGMDSLLHVVSPLSG
jgi:hypothetical protein